MNIQKIASTLNRMKTMLEPSPKADEKVLKPEMQKAVANYKAPLEHAAQKYQVPVELLSGLMLQVSEGNPDKINSAGAKGLMQLSPDNAKRFNIDANDTAQNLEGGAKLLREMMDRYHGDEDKAVAAYWFGSGSVDKLGMTPKLQDFAHSVSSLRDAAQIQLQGNDWLKNLGQIVEKVSDLDYEKWIQDLIGQAPLDKTAPNNVSETKTPTAPKIPDNIGFISAKYESGSRGVEAISSGNGDPGGVSYGVHQLSSNAGTMTSFLSSPECQSYAENFKNLKPGTEAFNKAYTALVKSNGDGFAKAQQDFITRTHYEPRLKLATELGFKVENRGVQEAIYSVSVQHGGADKLLTQIAQSPGFKDMSAEDQLKNLYQQRTDYAVKYAPQVEKGLRNRYTHELKDVLEIAKKSPTQSNSAAHAADSAAAASVLSKVDSSKKEIAPVLDASKYVYQFDLPNGKVACFDASAKMLKNAGISLAAGYKALGYFQLAQQSNGKDVVDPNQAQSAYSYVDQQLESGKPVVAGITYKQANYNFDNTTDHFVVIVGRGYDAEKGQTYYRYYDPGSKIRGLSEENRLYINSDGSAQGRSACNPAQTYTISQIRKNPA